MLTKLATGMRGKVSAHPLLKLGALIVVERTSLAQIGSRCVSIELFTYLSDALLRCRYFQRIGIGARQQPNKSLLLL